MEVLVDLLSHVVVAVAALPDTFFSPPVWHHPWTLHCLAAPGGDLRRIGLGVSDAAGAVVGVAGAGGVVVAGAPGTGSGSGECVVSCASR